MRSLLVLTMAKQNIIFLGDSYKQIHDKMYPQGTEYVYSYLEARSGGEFNECVFFGLQYYLQEYLEGVVLTREMIDTAEIVMKAHFAGNGDVWSREKWDYIVDKHGGRLPILIRAVTEGTVVPESNVLMTIVNTDPKCYWLPNFLETVLQNVWYPITVATRSYQIVKTIKKYFAATADPEKQFLANYYFHDFGQRAVSDPVQAGIGGMAHLVNSWGTDTVMGIEFARKYYNADPCNVAYSVAASEHSIMTSLGESQEFEVTKDLIRKFPKGILSVVSDSYNISRAVETYGTELIGLIKAREGKFVVRPDSPRFKGDTPQDQVLWIVKELEKHFGSTVNSKGYKVLHPSVGVIYGDGIGADDIEAILDKLLLNGYSSENCVFGCGGYLLQKLNRDTLRMAFKSSAQCRDGKWYDIFKKPLDPSKASKAGMLKLCYSEIDGYKTRNKDDMGIDEMRIVFHNGVLFNSVDFDYIREQVGF